MTIFGTGRPGRWVRRGLVTIRSAIVAVKMCACCALDTTAGVSPNSAVLGDGPPRVWNMCELGPPNIWPAGSRRSASAMVCFLSFLYFFRSAATCGAAPHHVAPSASR